MFLKGNSNRLNCVRKAGKFKKANQRIFPDSGVPLKRVKSTCQYLTAAELLSGGG